MIFSHPPDSLSNQEPRNQERGTNFESFESLLQAAPQDNFGNTSYTTEESDISRSDRHDLIRSTYSSSVAASRNSRDRASQARMLSYNPVSTGVSTGQSTDSRMSNLQMASQLANPQGASGQQPASLLGSNDQQTQGEPDENLAASKYLSKEMPDVYY